MTTKNENVETVAPATSTEETTARKPRRKRAPRGPRFLRFRHAADGVTAEPIASDLAPIAKRRAKNGGSARGTNDRTTVVVQESQDVRKLVRSLARILSREDGATSREVSKAFADQGVRLSPSAADGRLRTLALPSNGKVSKVYRDDGRKGYVIADGQSATEVAKALAKVA